MLNGSVISPISALCVPFVIAEYDQYAAFGTRDSRIPQDSQALISGLLRSLRKYYLIGDNHA